MLKTVKAASIIILLSLVWGCAPPATVSVRNAQSKGLSKDSERKKQKPDRECDHPSSGCNNRKVDYVTPTRVVKGSELPVFSDDLDFEFMRTALDRQINRFKKKKLKGTIKFGNKIYSRKVMLYSVQAFKEIVTNTEACLKSNKRTNCYLHMNNKLHSRFDIYVPLLKRGDDGYGKKRPVKFTAYYTPAIHGTVEKTKETPWPIYSRPADEKLARLTRAEIMFGKAFKGKGLELFHGADLFKMYLMQIEGGGKFIAHDFDGKSRSFYLSFDGSNRQKGTFIGRYMLEKGYIDNGSVAAQAEYLSKNPKKWKEIFSVNKNYVYFKVTEQPPEGSDVVSLTDNRSIATDWHHYGLKGVMTYVIAKRPNLKGPGVRSFSRFMIDQDTGSAIKGKSRVDLYFGEGDYAEKAANSLVTDGWLYFLMLK